MEPKDAEKETEEKSLETMFSSSNHADVLIVVPLQEEFDEVVGILSPWWTTKLIGSWAYGFTAVARKAKDGKATEESIKVAVVKLLEMGNQPALEQTRSALDIVRPKAVFCIGIGGSVKDFKLGDVAVSRAVSEIVDAAKVSTVVSRSMKRAKENEETGDKKVEENSKLEEGKKTEETNAAPSEQTANKDTKEESHVGSYQLELMHRQFEASARLLQAIGFLERNEPQMYEEWREEGKKELLRDIGLKKGYEKLSYDRHKAIVKSSNPKPKADICHFASGLVFATSHLDLRKGNREVKVIETEGAGVGRACVHRDVAVPFIVLRGISDFADEKKAETEAGTDKGYWPAGAWRKLAVRNAARYLKMILGSNWTQQAVLDSGCLNMLDFRRKDEELAQNGKVRFSSGDLMDVMPLMTALLAKPKEPGVLYVSAGDLWIARPLLTHREDSRHRWFPIKTIRVLTFDPDLLPLLKEHKIVSHDAFDALIPNLRGLYTHVCKLGDGKCVLEHAFWDGLPPFHGYLIGDYLWRGSWGAGTDGLLKMLHSDITILRKDAFPEEFNEILSQIEDLEYKTVDEARLVEIEAAYGKKHSR